jgi:hypothetical protein
LGLRGADRNVAQEEAVTTTNWISAVTPIIAVIITLTAGWLIGQRVTDHWERARKRRELDMSALGELYRCYGEFYAIWKAWNRYCRLMDPSAAPPNASWDLLLRATAAEGSVEALLTKIVTERELNDTEVDALGALRQAYHQLRLAIREDRSLSWDYSAHQDYTAFKGLQTLVAELLTRSSGERPGSADAARNFARVTSNKYEVIFPDAAVEAGVYYPDGRDVADLKRPLRRKARSTRSDRSVGSLEYSSPPHGSRPPASQQESPEP